MSSTEEKTKWTRVSRKRRRPRLPPCWKLRFPAHLRSSLKTPSGTDSDSEDSDGSISGSVLARLLEALQPQSQQEPDPGPNLNPNNYLIVITGHALD